MRIVFALFIILYTAAVLSFTLPRQEQEAIVALKRAIPSLPSKWPSFSDSNITDCNATFPGLTCTGASVTSLDLSSLGLCCSGSIPQEIGYFTNLSTLALPGIGLTGSIPNSVAGLTKLTTLSLQNNKLSGSIPNFFFSPALTSLFLQNNSLTGHIPSVSANTLKDFNLDSNSLDGSVPAWLGDQTYSALTSSSVNIGGQAGGKAYTGCAPRLHRGAAGTSCNYYNDSGLSCYCPGECSASPCTCPLTGITGTAASCSDHTTIYTGGTSTSTAQTGNILYYRCETTLCKYDLSTSTQTKLTTNAAGDVYLGGNSVVYFYDATSVSTIDAAGAVTIVLPSIDTTTVKVFPSTTGILIYTAANGLYKISGSVSTPIIDSTTLSTNAVVEAIEVGSTVLFTKSVDPGVFVDTTTTPVCGVSTDAYSNLVVGPTNTAFVYKRTATPTDSLVTIDVSVPSCTELTTTPESPNIDNPAAIYFGSFLYYYTSGKNIAKVDTSATPGVVVTANTLTVKPVFFVAQTHLFASLDSNLGYFNGTLFEQLNSLFATTATTLAIVDNQLFGNFNGDLREWNSGTKAWSSASLGTIPVSEQVLVPGSTSTIAYIDTASGDIRLYKNLYSACKFPNQCTYSNKATCVPNFVSSVSVTCTVDITCNTTVNTLLDGSCVPKDLCALTSSCPQFGMSCTLDSSSSPNCTDIDQCATGAHRCLNRTCINTNPGFYTCAAVCPTGYEVNGAYRCQDTDECQTATTCSGNATCNNTVGNYTCTCNTNYTGNAYVANGCYKTNPCGDNPCSANADCNNTGNGAFTCTCHAGFNGSSCTNIDECQAGTHNCSANAICTDTPGSFNCTCKPGYNGTGYVCNNIDECTAGTHNCSADATCTDTPGSFNCTCKPGYTGNGNVCTNVNECQGVNNCSTNANCTDTPGSYTCTCKNGYSGNGVNCTDINECANSTLNNCNTANGTCTNTNGSYTCACKAGYTGNGIVCNDIDECANATLNTCSSNATCTNTNGNFTCACKSGYSGDGYTCTNIDECQTANNCSTNAVCTDKPGTYNCTCKSGYTGNGFNCTNINECLNTTICGINAFCTDFSGGYNCTCNTNYSGDAYVQCYDDAPCRSKPCDTNADCAGTATPGGFTCTCKSGWTGNGTLPSLCTNINECLNTTACVPNAICADTNGSFTCTCDSANGYTGNGNWNAGGLAGCYFADPCLKLNPCDSNATCSNQGSGKYSCTCKGGFSGVGNVTGGCYYTSPCTTLDPCGANSVCNNTGNGNYNCSCSSGYQYNSSNVCVDIDECEVNNQCPSNTTCTNSDGSFDCACLTGYRGATTVGSEGCAPIDGCQEIAGICGADTSCTPSGPNKTDCACLAGFQGIPPNCKCVISGTFSGCALTANGTIVINGTATASTTVNAHTSISAGATLLAPSVAVVNFMNGVDVQGTFDIRNADAVQVSGGLQIGNDGVLKLGSSSLRTSNLRISNCQSNTIAGQVILTLPPNPQTVTWNIESTCALSIPSNIISLDSPNADCAPPSASALTNGIVTITVDCSPKSPPAPDTPIGAIVGGVVGGVVVIVLIIIFAVPSIRNKILRNDDDFGDSDDSDDKPKNKPPARNTSENSRTGKPIPNPPFNVTAIADYMAVDTSQISVTKGVIYTVQRVDEGQHWFQAKGANGKLGWFPASYARIEN